MYENIFVFSAFVNFIIAGNTFFNLFIPLTLSAPMMAVATPSSPLNRLVSPYIQVTKAKSSVSPPFLLFPIPNFLLPPSFLPPSLPPSLQSPTLQNLFRHIMLEIYKAPPPLHPPPYSRALSSNPYYQMMNVYVCTFAPG